MITHDPQDHERQRFTRCYCSYIEHRCCARRDNAAHSMQATSQTRCLGRLFHIVSGLQRTASAACRAACGNTWDPHRHRCRAVSPSSVSSSSATQQRIQWLPRAGVKLFISVISGHTRLYKTVLCTFVLAVVRQAWLVHFVMVQMYLTNGNTGQCQCCYPAWASSSPNYTFLVPYLNATAMPDLWSHVSHFLST